MLEIVRIPVLSDNYVWLVHEPGSGETAVVDPAGGRAGARRGGGARLADHPDLEHPLAPRPHRRQRGDQGGDRRLRHRPRRRGGADPDARPAGAARATGCALGPVEAEVLEVPAHTAGHIAYHLPSEEAVFVGDTLFAMGCGRLFEGTAEQMHANLQRLAALAARDPGLLRARIYALQRPLRGDRRAGQRGARRPDGRGRGGARRAARRRCRRRSRSSSPPTRSCALHRRRSLLSGAGPRIISERRETARRVGRFSSAGGPGMRYLLLLASRLPRGRLHRRRPASGSTWRPMTRPSSPPS